MAQINVFPLSIGGVSPPLNLLANIIGNATLSPLNFTYPLDLGSNPNYGHAVTFTAEQQNFSDLTGLLSNLNPKTITNQQNTDTLGYISLYLPDTLNTTYNHNWGEVSLTQELPTGATFFTGAAADVADLAQHGTDNDQGNYMQLFGKSAAAGIAGLLNPTLGGVVGNAIGVVQNPHLQLLYKGIGLREFQFEFIFTPSSPQEAQMVDKIINQFTIWSVPGVAGSASNNYLTPPQLFSIRFAFLNNTGLVGAVTNFFNNIGTNIIGTQLTAALGLGTVTNQTGSEAKIFQIYNTCALTNMTVDYAPNGWASYQDGYPIETRLTLQFKETDIVTKQTLGAQTSSGIMQNTVQNAVQSSMNSFSAANLPLASSSGSQLTGIAGVGEALSTNVSNFVQGG